MSYVIPVKSLDGFVEEVELLQNSCAEGEFRTAADASSISTSTSASTSASSPCDFDLVLNHEPEVLLRVQGPQESGAGGSSSRANLTLCAPSADSNLVQSLKKVIESRLAEDDFAQAEYKIYDVFLFLQGAISDGDIVFPSDQEHPKQEAGTQDESASAAPPSFEAECKMTRCIFWSHHLKSTTKKKNIRAWCSELRVWGITRPGYPAFLLFEGAEEDVDEMIRRIKDQNWHALSLRACVRYTYARPPNTSNEGSSSSSSSSSTHDLALLHCPLAQNHPSNNTTNADGAQDLSTVAKLRPGVEEIESISELVGRLRAVGIPEMEYTEALGLRT
ncbi:unnamed protein product [Tilletia controversa]|uniref:Uncharacterized protein n=3 Tax=Tilletia TaxID=13289 RepID=A0A8X7MS15_9BASI|nr:hypothetical protein CF336_g1901 [Tilletia laevis]KAE8200333.1 hypothetical protein CF328_g2994 [Tilletia controversa]KAE8262288.1 hypothetical protein A4X03_0g2577 [Tilletia caries]KAE8199903.1 hypothetical protein CF335_g4057 [Tilletia laevis]KAE8245976.1 hypothetical protein A4X06_0g5284 [Tilletia controversa]